MHTEKQVKDTPSRMFRQPEGKGTQQFRLRDNRGSAVVQGKVVQRVPDIIYQLSSSTLGKNLGNPPLFGRYIVEAHHIIPVNIINSDFDNRHSKKEPYGTYASYDEAWNGIFLPGSPRTEEAEDNGCNLPYHRRGQLNHTQYDDFVKSLLQDKDLTSCDQSKTQNIHNIANQLRNIIEKMQGNVCLDDITANLPTQTSSSSWGQPQANLQSIRASQSSYKYTLIDPENRIYQDAVGEEYSVFSLSANNKFWRLRRNDGYDLLADSADFSDSPERLSPEVELGQRSWSPSENKKLLQAVQQYGTDNWAKVSQMVKTQNRRECAYRWSRFLNPQLSTSHWTPEEDEKLMGLVANYGERRWNMIATLMQNRSDVQCRYHYNQIKTIHVSVAADVSS